MALALKPPEATQCDSPWSGAAAMAPQEVAGRPRRDLSITGDSKSYAAIISAAHDVFSSVGYHTATVEDICRIAAVSRTTFYFYFRDKRHIFRIIVREVLEGFYQLSEIRDEGLDGYDRIVVGHFYYMRAWSKDRRLLRDFAALSWHEPDFIELRETLRSRIEPRIEAHIGRLVSRGQIAVSCPSLTTHALTGMVEWFCLRYFAAEIEPGEEELRLLDGVRTLSEAWYKALYGRTPPTECDYQRLIAEHAGSG